MLNFKVLGWQNSATYGSVISYNCYWIAVSLGFLVMLFSEKRGHYPFMKPSAAASSEGSDTGASGTRIESEKGNIMSATKTASAEV